MSSLFNRELLLRVISALVLLPVVLLPVWYGGLPFLFLLVVAGAMMYREWLLLTGVRAALVMPATLVTTAILIAGAVLITSQPLAARAVYSVALASLSLGIVSRLFGWREPFWIAAGWLYVLLPLGAFLYLGLATEGPFWIYWVLVVVWATDIGAFFAGRIIGGPKLSKRYSPKKTWAGLAGGIAAAIFLSWLGTDLAGEYWKVELKTLAPPLYFAGFLALLSQAGDLFESALKRHFGVKDSSGLIPGHGGLLDRVDGLVFVVVAVALYMGINYA